MPLKKIPLHVVGLAYRRDNESDPKYPNFILKSFESQADAEKMQKAVNKLLAENRCDDVACTISRGMQYAFEV